MHKYKSVLKCVFFYAIQKNKIFLAFISSCMFYFSKWHCKIHALIHFCICASNLKAPVIILDLFIHISYKTENCNYISAIFFTVEKSIQLGIFMYYSKKEPLSSTFQYQKTAIIVVFEAQKFVLATLFEIHCSILNLNFLSSLFLVTQRPCLY